MNKLAILGASGHGKVVADIAEQSGWKSVFFHDDAWPNKTSIGVWSIVGDSSSLINSLHDYDAVTVAIGDNSIRKQKLDILEKAGCRLATLIHPTAIISRYATIDSGSVVMAGVIVNAGTSIGKGVILNTGCTIDHDCKLDDFVHISPGAHLAGNVCVGTKSWIGTSVSTRQSITIGKEVIVGVGAVVIDSLPDGVTAIGVPARF